MKFYIWWLKLFVLRSSNWEMHQNRILLDVIFLFMDEILYMMAQNVHLMELLLNVAPKLYSGNIWSVYHSRRRKLCIPYSTSVHTHISWSSKSNLVVQHDKAHQDENFKLSYVKFHQKIKKIWIIRYFTQFSTFQ